MALQAMNGRTPRTRGKSSLIPLADPNLRARVTRSKVNNDLSVRIEDSGGRVVKDLGSRRYKSTTSLHQHLAKVTPTQRGTATAVLRIYGGIGSDHPIGTDTDHEGSCPAVFGDGDPCTCG